ncbi:GNAT family N-acetyltransferase [Qipengyuania sp.]|uniref:GNAT family N-acetyltransferase n=1 Tax=Qipengyuania sp. TaxID=2004515 RepID=UPI003AF44F70
MSNIADLIDAPKTGAPARPLGPAPLPDGFSVAPWQAIIHPLLAAGWADLARDAATANPFLEHWFLAPSLAQFDPDGQVLLATLVEDGRLVALMPLWRDTDYTGHYLPHLANWIHPNCFCGEPLVARGRSRAFWDQLLAWCDRNQRASLFLHLACLPTDGMAFGALRDLCAKSGRSFAPVKLFERAALRSGASPEEHLSRTLERKRRKELARKRRRLEELGTLEFSRSANSEGIEDWIDGFLALERSGWKGEQGSSLASAPETEALFRKAVHGAAAEGRVERLAFWLDGKPIAMLCNFVAPPVSFGFKTAFDEAYRKYSPGMLLQVENLALLTRSEIELSDSCAVPGNPMIEHIWSDRREMAMVSIGIGGRLRRAIGAVLTGIELRREEARQ